MYHLFLFLSLSSSPSLDFGLGLLLERNSHDCTVVDISGGKSSSRIVDVTASSALLPSPSLSLDSELQCKTSLVKIDTSVEQTYPASCASFCDVLCVFFFSYCSPLLSSFCYSSLLALSCSFVSSLIFSPPHCCY